MINDGEDMLCPRCEQGDIVAATIRSTRQRLFVCGECEATWFALHDVAHVRFVDYGTYMKSIGLKPLWDELELDDAHD